jgi:hypothetical protein
MLRHEGAFARKVLPLGDGLVVLYDKPVVLVAEWGRPSRTVFKVDGRGQETMFHAPASGRSVVDVAVHPSGDITVLEASDGGWFLLRFGELGALRGEVEVVDPAVLTDLPAIGPAESTSPIERVTRDAGRIAADGEDVFGALRTGRHSVIAYRWGDGLSLRSRTLVVPAHFIQATGLHGGTYDTFGQLEAHYGVFVGVDSDHVGYVGTSHARMESGLMLKAHKAVFGEALVTDPDWLDAYVTRVDAEGKRLGTSVVGTADDEQLYELRAGAHGVYALGRSERWNEQGTGFDAMAAHVDATGKVTMRTFDVASGDIAFDALEEPDGSLLVAGASGYAQNPNGASIVEASEAFVRRLRADGTTETVAIPLRHNEARSLVRRSDGRIVAGGMTDGPGTHSGDGDHALVRAHGWVGGIAGQRRQ